MKPSVFAVLVAGGLIVHGVVAASLDWVPWSALPFLAGVAVAVLAILGLFVYGTGRFYGWWAVALVALLPGVGLAQEAQTSAPSFLGGLLTPANIGGAVVVVLGLFGSFKWFGVNAKRRVAKAAYYAFHIVEDIGIEKEGDDAFDKTAEALKKVDEYFLANGWRAPKPGDVALAKLELQALHGAEVAKTKVAVAAATAAAEASAEVPIGARPTAP